MNTQVIINNKLVIIDRLPSESDEVFYDRINFILKNLEKIKNLQELISYSKIYSNIKYKKCFYNTSVEVLIKDIEKPY
jgi:hypothetical protein